MNSYATRAALGSHEFVPLTALDAAHLPFSLKLLLENALRTGSDADVEAVLNWDHREIAFTPARVLLQDFTGVPAVVDLAAMRDAVAELGGDPPSINPLLPVELVIDHSVQVDEFGTRRRAVAATPSSSSQRNQERYAFLRWGQTGVPQLRGRAAGHRHRPPGQPRVPRARRVHERRSRRRSAYPDTLVGTDSHTTMINGLGVLGWGVGGIEAEAAMLGPAAVDADPAGASASGCTASCARARPRPTSCSPSPRCCARRASSASSSSSSARAGGAAARRPRDDRQHGARVRRDLRHLPDRRRDAALPAPHRPLGRRTSRWSRRTRASRACSTSPARRRPTTRETLELDLGDVEPSVAGPKRPQDRVAARRASRSRRAAASRSRGRRPRRRSARRRRRDAPARSRPDVTTARSSSPRSPAAPTPRTRR